MATEYTARVFVKWRYTSDRNVEYVFKILKAITDQKTTGAGTPVKVGGVAAAGTELRAADSFRPRVALLYNAEHKLSRRIVCFSTQSPLYCGTSPAGENTLTLFAGSPSILLPFVCYGYEGERQRGERV